MFIQNNEEESDIRWGHKEQNASSDQKKREKVEVHQQTANQHKFNRSQKNKEKVEDYPLKNKSFAPIPSSGDRFARQNHYGPPFPSDLANFESKSNENSLRQPPRFCNTKKPLLISFKMPYSKPKSEQKWRFKLNEKTGDQIPTFTIEKRTYVGGLLLQFKPSFLLGFWLGIWHFKELKQTFLGVTEPWRLSKWIFVRFRFKVGRQIPTFTIEKRLYVAVLWEPIEQKFT